MALGKIAFTAAVGGAIDREAYGAIAELQRPFYRAIHPFLVAAHIELEELGIVGGTADLFKTGRANRTQHMDDAGTRCGARWDHAAFGDDVLHRTDRRKHDRELELLAQQGRAGIDVLDIAQHARAEREAIERQAILVKGRLGFRAAHEVIPGARRKFPLGQRQKLKQRIHLTDIGHATLSDDGRSTVNE